MSENKEIVIEKLCVFCEHFKWSASESTGCDTCGPTHEHAECKAEVPQFDYEIPDDSDDFRALILKATNCQHYRRNGTAK